MAEPRRKTEPSGFDQKPLFEGVFPRSGSGPVIVPSEIIGGSTTLYIPKKVACGACGREKDRGSECKNCGNED
jgi:hypothetical protein